MDARHAAAIEAYLAAPPYTGRSEYRHSQALKGATGGRWDPDRKKWVARNEEVLVRMIQTGRWVPDVEVSSARVVAYVQAKQAKLEAQRDAEVSERGGKAAKQEKPDAGARERP